MTREQVTQTLDVLSGSVLMTDGWCDLHYDVDYLSIELFDLKDGRWRAFFTRDGKQFTSRIVASPDGLTAAVKAHRPHDAALSGGTGNG